MKDRITDAYLTAGYVDGQTFLHTDANNIVSVLKEGVNANYKDIQKILNGDLAVESANTIEGCKVAKFVEGTLDNNDNTIPTSQRVKAYVDDEIARVKPVKGVDYWTDQDIEDLKTMVVNDVLPDATNSFNVNAENKTNEFNEMVDTETNIFNVNADAKLNDVANAVEEGKVTLSAYEKTKEQELSNYADTKLKSDIDDYIDSKKPEAEAYFDNEMTLRKVEFNSFTESEKAEFREEMEDLLTQVDNVDIDATKSGKTVTINVSKKDGTEKTVYVVDGEQGPQGIQGEIGPVPNVQVGTVTASAPGADASVSRGGSNANPIFNFVIPRGETGPIGPEGPPVPVDDEISDTSENAVKSRVVKEYIDTILGDINSILAEIVDGPIIIDEGTEGA